LSASALWAPEGNNFWHGGNYSIMAGSVLLPAYRVSSPSPYAILNNGLVIHPMNSIRSRFLLPLVLCGAILAVSTASLFIRYAQQEKVPALVIAAWRLSLAAVFLLPSVLLKYRADLRHLRWPTLGICMLAGVFLALHFAAWITSLEYTSVASSVVLVTTTPLWVTLCAPFVLGEHPSPITVAGMLLALSGGILIALGGNCPWMPIASWVFCVTREQFSHKMMFVGDALALCGAWMAAGYVLVGRKVRIRLALVPYLLLVYGIAALLLVGIVLGTRQRLVGYSPVVYLWLFLLALVPQLVGHSSLNWALRHLPAAFVSIALLGEPVGSILLVALFLGEKPLPAEIAGGLIVLAGIYLASQRTPAARQLE